MNTKQKGKFITLEGIEGVGKSSNVRFIAEQIQMAGIEVLITREPGGTIMAEDIRQILLKKYTEPTLPLTELLLLYAARLQHVECVIKPALMAGKWVICDRFTDATFAYQGAGRHIPAEKINSLNHWVLDEFTSDLTFVLDAPVELAFGRIQQERQLDRFEQEQHDFFERIRQAYLARAKLAPNKYEVIDASKSLAEVQQKLAQVLKTIMV